MVEIGSLLSSLPDRPLPIATVEGLEEHDAIVVAVPIQTEEEKQRDQAVTERFALVTSSVGVILEYFPERGWAVVKKVNGKDLSEKEMVAALVGESIKWQDELDELADAAMAGDLQERLEDSEVREIFEG
jgi:hypothetical protein